MKLIHYKLAEVLVELPNIKKSFLEKPVFATTLSECKRNILDSYTSSISDILVKLASMLIEIETDPSKEFINELCKDTPSLFRRFFLHNECANCRISPLYHIFQSFRGNFEEDVFDKLRKQLLDQLHRGNITSTLPVIYRRVCSEMVTFVELSTLFLSGIHIDCDNFKDEIYDKEVFSIYNKEIIDKAKSTPCCMKSYVNNQGGDSIHVFMISEYRFRKYIEAMIFAVSEVHKQPKNIKIIVNYKLHPPFKYEEEHYEVYKLAQDLFKEVVCINHDHVDFGEYGSKIQTEEKDFKEAASELIGEGTAIDRRRVPLIGDILVRQNRISTKQLEDALIEQRRRDDGSLLGDILKKNYNITQEEINQALEEQNYGL
jgi:hypothetical protein